MSKKDYYEVLGVAKNVSDADLKKAFKRMAMKLHPDRNPDDKDAEEKFKEAKEAYDILSDAKKRAAYDQFGHAGVDASMGGGAGAGGFGGGLVLVISVIFLAMYSVTFLAAVAVVPAVPADNAPIGGQI